jgi:two-component system NarL family sensor kinase
VSESTRADELRNAELAEHLHDGPLQTLLAARLDLDEISERIPDPALDRVRAALQETAAGLRSTVTALHPQVLAQLGLAPAIRELLRQTEKRYDIEVIGDIEDVGHPPSQSLLYRAARELLANVTKHADARTVTVTLHRHGDRTVLTVSDDGAGFELSRVTQSVAEGHIGLASLQVRIEATGGVMKIESQPNLGTRVTVTL